MKKLLLACLFLAGTALAAGADIIAFPNPWIPEDVPGRRSGTLADGIAFGGLPANGEIFIYTVSGNLVRHLTFSNSAGIERWNAKNEDGSYVASGVYLWVVKSPERTKTGKLVIVR